MAVAIATSLPAYTASAQAPQAATEAARQFDIPAGPLGAALDRFSTQSGLQVAYQRELVASRQAPALSGQLTWREALGRLLAGSGLEYLEVNGTTIAIRRAEGGGVTTATPPVPLATRPQTAATAAGNADVTEMSRLSVTGTRIRGGVSASPTITMDDLQFRQEGFTDLGEVIRSLPQNYRGGQNPGVTSGAGQGADTNNNITGGSSLNLRGLGPDATLTLLNGRRMSYDGYSQAVDISAIPIEAVERVEIVPDGSSAIYGSDAVGGVANVVLKRDFDGVTLGTVYGDSADGGLKRHDYTITAGAAWNSGGLIATFKKSDTDPIFADQRDYTQPLDDPFTIYRGSSVRSGLVSAYQSLGQAAELRLDALRTVREQAGYIGYDGFHLFDPTEATVTLVAPSLEVSLPGDWMLTSGASRGANESIYDSVIVRDGTQTPNSYGSYFNETLAWEVGLEGPLARFGQRDLRLAVGLGGRRDEFEQRTFTSGARLGGEERSHYAYGELLVPVVGADNARPGLRRLEMSAAVRSEDYESFGRVTTPKIGLIYGPSPDFTLKTSWGRSFKAPTLRQRHSQRYTILYRAQQIGCISCPADTTVLLAAGGSPDLEPERARTWTASLAFHPEAVPALDAELTFFSIDYTDRVLNPVSVVTQTLSDPAYAEFIEYDPSPEQLEQVLNEFNYRFSNLSGAPYDPNNVGAIGYIHLTNVARQRAKGLDLTGSYRFDLAAGQLMLRGGASWLDLSQQSRRGGEEIDLSGRIFFPAELNGRLGAVWSRGGLSVSTFANYTSGVTSTLTADIEELGSFTTFDTTVRYETAPGNTPLSGLTLGLSVDNMFNRAPPLHTSAFPRSYAAYDSTNYSAIGRYVTLSLSKHW
nr:TonB-dependent receptor [Luteimonas sp. XNQY3]